MIKERRNQLIDIYKQSQELSNWLWMGILSDDEERVQQDIEWAKQISLQIAEGLFGYTGIEKYEMAKALTYNETDTPPTAYTTDNRPRTTDQSDIRNHRWCQLSGSSESLGERPRTSPSVVTPRPRTVRLA